MTRTEAIRKILDHRLYSREDIALMLDRAEKIGLDLGPMSPLEELTVEELNILTQDTNGTRES